jgi:ATP-binding cassette subfamily C protein LapB
MPNTKVNPESHMDNNPKQWTFNPDLAAPFDPLLECLLILAKFHNKPTSAPALTAGLPLVDHKLTPELCKRAANRIGLSTKIIKCKLSDIKESQLPLILFLQEGKAVILTKFDNDKAKVIQPEIGENTIDMPMSELEKLYVGFTILIEPAFDFSNIAHIEPHRITAKHWFINAFKKMLPMYSEVLLASCLINIFALASPLFVMNVYDRVVPNNAVETLWVLAIGVIIVFGFDFVMRNLRAFFIDFAGKKVDTELSSHIFAQLMDIQMAARPESTGFLTNTVHAFEFFREFITSASVSLLVDVPFAFLFILVMGILGGTIALVPLAIIPTILIVNFLAQIPLNELIEKSHVSTGESHSILIESIVGTETIKCFRAEGLMQRKWENINNLIAKFGVKMRALANLTTNSAMYAQQLALVFIIVIGVYKISVNEMTMGALIACVILSSRAFAPIAQIGVLLTRYGQSKASLKSLNEIMQMPLERPIGKRFLYRSELIGNIEFRDVIFTYPHQNVPALNHVSLKINHGEKVGILGRIGSGKSTLEKLLLKLYRPDSGSILIDSTEIQQIDPVDLRRYIGYVPQDVVLFQGTIRDNIVIGAPYVDDTAIIRAAKLSGVESFVNTHPLGFDQPVSERGQNLSGGQRQAIALARALLLDPPILIFDEPGNSIDENTIAQFVNELGKFASNKTLILVTHKMSLLSLVDRLIILDAGKIIVDDRKEKILHRLAEIHEQAIQAAKIREKQEQAAQALKIKEEQEQVEQTAQNKEELEQVVKNKAGKKEK